MANLWDSLDDAQRNVLTRAAIAGAAKTPENMNRARQQLIENPNLVEKLAKEHGVIEDDETLQDEDDVAASNEVEQNVDAALAEEGDVQQVGNVSKSLPPPMEGEDVNAYYDRIRKTPNGYEVDDRDLTYETGNSMKKEDWRRIRPRSQ